MDVVFNNHYRGKAVVNAAQFRTLLHGTPAPAPPTLMAAYPDELAGFATADPGPGDWPARLRRAAGSGLRSVRPPASLQHTTPVNREDDDEFGRQRHRRCRTAATAS